MVEAYWNVGRKIVEEEQFGKKRAVYGEFLIEGLSARLKDELGSGFDVTNLKRMRQFYVLFPKGATAWHFLSWSHFKAVLRVEKEDARAWYLQEASEQNWSVRALERQIGTLVFASQYRLVLPTEEELRREIERERDLVIREHMEHYG